MEYEKPQTDYWTMKSSELRDHCREISHGSREMASDWLRTEAHQLAVEWQDALEMPQNDAFQESRKATQLAALRKRTIEILVKVYGDA